jgi:hypothetical protein
MKRIVQTILSLASTCAVLAQGTFQVVVPNAQANTEGNSSASGPFTNSSFRFQQVFDASQFAIPLGASGRMNNISFRIDGAATESMLLFFGGSSWTFSTTTRSPDSLSPVFADNPGADAVTVRNGAFSFAGNPATPGMPGDFQNPTVSFTSEFWYDPSRGNLLLEVAGVAGQAFRPGALDGHTAVGDSVSWVFANSNLTPSGSTDTFGLVTRFDFTIIPEPASWQLLIVAILVSAIVFRKNQRTTATFKSKRQDIRSDSTH